ncbi:MAG: glutamate synthase subunit beta [Ferrimicrobium sp.]
MGDIRGFLRIERGSPSRRSVSERLGDWDEVYRTIDENEVAQQASRCMDCGIPFCHHGCPLGNRIPDWNDLVGQGRWTMAVEQLFATNNFPEFTGRLCPAPCEAACVLGINREAVTIEWVEKAIAEHAFDHGLASPVIPSQRTGRRVAVVGSGPSGLAAAQQLTRAGHDVTVFERADAIGGLLRYGIPHFKLEKWVLERRLSQMEAEGTRFVTNANIGSFISLTELRRKNDAVVLAMGSTTPRDLDVPGRTAPGVLQAMEYLPIGNRGSLGQEIPCYADAKDRRVVIIGGGDTGSDCLGTALRQGARSVVQLEILPEPPRERAMTQPWPTWPIIYRVSSAHEEGGDRFFARQTVHFELDDAGAVAGLCTVDVVIDSGGVHTIADTETTIPADLVILALGFVGPELSELGGELGLVRTETGTVETSADWMTSLPGVFAAGDARRGQSLIVWAIAEGRAVAAAVDRFLVGQTDLPAPIDTKQRPLAVG